MAKKKIRKPAKTQTSTIRWTEDEYAFLRDKKAAWDVSIAALLRTCIRIALGIPTIEEANIRRFQQIERQLSGLSSNLNQMARAANAGKLMWTEGDAATVDTLSETVRSTRLLFREYQRQAACRGFDRSKVEAKT